MENDTSTLYLAPFKTEGKKGKKKKNVPTTHDGIYGCRDANNVRLFLLGKEACLEAL